MTCACDINCVTELISARIVSASYAKTPTSISRCGAHDPRHELMAEWEWLPRVMEIEMVGMLISWYTGMAGLCRLACTSRRMLAVVARYYGRALR